MPEFLGGGDPSIIAQQTTPILLIALAQCVVLQIGSIDLSNAAVALLCAILTAKTLGPIGIVSPFLYVGAVTVIGMLNGFVLTRTQTPSFALTPGMLGILQRPASSSRGPTSPMSRPTSATSPGCSRSGS